MLFAMHVFWLCRRGFFIWHRATEHSLVILSVLLGDDIPSAGRGIHTTELSVRGTDICSFSMFLRILISNSTVERRNLFLSKIEALPSPTATSLPVTPPESPAVFHFSLPSPGLVSPLALFETLDHDGTSRPVRVEQVDFRARARKEAEALASLTGYTDQSLQMHGLATVAPKAEKRQSRATKQSLPSLDQISKRLGGNITITRAASPGSRLPAFLQRSASPPKEDMAPTAPLSAPTPVAAPIPKYSFTPTNVHGPIARPALSTGNRQTRPPPPTSVTLAGPHIASTRPSTPLTAEALNALAYRAERGTVMMERLQRRFSAPARMSGQQSIQRMLARPVGGF